MTTASTVIIAGASYISTAYAEDKQQTNISQEDLGAALLQVAQQRNVNIIYNPKLLKGKKASHVTGSFTTRELLQQLLSGSGYNVEADKKGNFYIRKETFNKTSGFTGQRNDAYTLVNNSSEIMNDAEAEIITEQGDDAAPNTENDAVNEEAEAEEYLEEVTVTGSHIRGAAPVGSKVYTYDREEIDRKGYATLPEFIQSLPQNFNGGISESTNGVSTENGANFNITNGTGVNLRGLGNASTLVLLNGQRMAPAGLGGNFVDISMIPLSAVESVEVLPDGASAIYGSDAIGGVVNFKMRKDYDGAETRLRYGLATQGGLEEFQVGQTFGKTWEQGYGLVSYEYNHRNPLDANDRSFSKEAPDPTVLLPEQERHSVFLTGGHNLTEGFELYTTAFYNKRNSDGLSTTPPFTPDRIDRITSKTEQYGATLGSTLDLDDVLGNEWEAEMVGSFSRNKSIKKIKRFSDPEDDTRILTKLAENISVGVKLDGSLFHIAGGEAKLAIGGNYRHDILKDVDVIGLGNILSPRDKQSRKVTALFGEFYVPLIGEDNRRSGIEKLALSFAGRYEHYNDFGSSTNPKFGALWSPIEGLNLRATYGTSFRAPLLLELDEAFNGVLLVGAPDDNAATGSSSILLRLIGGGNKDLQPENATIWTTGLDFQPVSAPNITFSATYFNIDYKNKIRELPPIGFFTVLNDPRFQPFINRDGADAETLALIENYTQFNATSIPGFGPPSDFSDAEVVLDQRIRNLARNKIRGIDFSLTYNLESQDLGNFNFSLAGTYLFNFLEQFSEGAPKFEVVSTRNFPIKLRMNGGVSWTHKGFAANLMINYTDSYLDTVPDPEVTVSSWTTTNLTISYNTEDRFDSFLDNTTFTLTAINLFDQNPPLVAAEFLINKIFYDPSAASPTGRVLSFQVTKQW
ncbi:MAG: TonB-dependent receptor [Emcibacter sp.]|nr:TonB-dependent receptor [Emcibacter sp.]